MTGLRAYRCPMQPHTTERVAESVRDLENALSRLTHPSHAGRMAPDTAAQARRASRAARVVTDALEPARHDDTTT